MRDRRAQRCHRVIARFGSAPRITFELLPLSWVPQSWTTVL